MLVKEKLQVQEIDKARARKENMYKGKREYRCKRLRQHVQVQEIVSAYTRERESMGCKRVRQHVHVHSIRCSGEISYFLKNMLPKRTNDVISSLRKYPHIVTYCMCLGIIFLKGKHKKKKDFEVVSYPTY